MLEKKGRDAGPTAMECPLKYVEWAVALGDFYL